MDVNMHDAEKENQKYNDQALNDEIEDIDSDQEDYEDYAAYQMHTAATQQHNASKVPGLSLGGIGGGNGVTIPAAKMGLGLNLGAVQQNAPSEKTIQTGLAMKMPGGGKGNDKVPSLNIGLTQNNKSEDQVMNSGSHSSKRDGIGRLNIGKAVAIQQ